MIELLLQAERALSVGLLDRAETLYRQVANADPRNSIAVVGLARVTLDRGDDVGALALGRRALEIDPENDAAIRLVARLEEVLDYRFDAAEALSLDGSAVEAGPEAGLAVGADEGNASEAVAEAESELEGAAEPASWAVPEVEAESEVQPSPRPEPEPEAIAEREVQSSHQPEPEPQPEPEAIAEREAGAEPEAEAEPEAAATVESAPEPERTPELERTPEPEPASNPRPHSSTTPSRTLPEATSGPRRSWLDRLLGRR